MQFNTYTAAGACPTAAADAAGWAWPSAAVRSRRRRLRFIGIASAPRPRRVAARSAPGLAATEILPGQLASRYVAGSVWRTLAAIWRVASYLAALRPVMRLTCTAAPDALAVQPSPWG